MEFNRFRDALADALGGLDPTGMTPETELTRLPAWDSLAILNAMEVADADFGAEVTGAEVRACATLGQLHQLVASRAPGANA